MKKLCVLFSLLFIFMSVMTLLSCTQPEDNSDAANVLTNNNHASDSIDSTDKEKIDLAPYQALLNGDIQATAIGTALVADGVSVGTLQTDAQWDWGSQYSDDTAPKELEVVFNGQTYKGTYDHSYVVAGTDYVKHAYSFTYMVTQNFVMSDGSISEFSDPYSGRFFINDSDNALSSISFNKVFDGDITQKEARIIAEQAATKFTDISEYRMVSTSEAGRLYSFRYIKYYQDIPTVECISIIVDKGGHVNSLSGHMYEMFPSDLENTVVADDVAKLISTDARAVVEAKAICAGGGHYDQATLSETPFWGMIDGELKLIYTASLSSSTDEHLHSHEPLYIIVETVENSNTQTE